MSPQAGELLVTQIIPRLRVLIPHSVSQIGHEDYEELVQDSTLIAVKMLNSAEARGKTVSAGNVAYYTVLHARSGRRSHSASRSDALGSRTQLIGNSRVDSFEHPLGHGLEPGLDEPQTLGDILASDAEDPATTAARNLDWQALLASLDERTRAVLQCLSGEVPLQQVADTFRVSRSTVQEWRDQLTELVRAFLGEDVLRQIQEAPRWQENLSALREQLACRIDRRMAA